MNFNLIEIKMDGVFVRTVNARDIHKELKSKQQFDKWISRRIEQGGFLKGEDFTTFLTKSTGGRPATYYHVTFDMAKHLGMMELNKKGRSIRQYFIDQDKAVSQVQKLLLEAQKAMKEYTEKASKWGEDGNLLKMKKPLMLDALNSAESLSQLTLKFDNQE